MAKPGVKTAFVFLVITHYVQVDDIYWQEKKQLLQYDAYNDGALMIRPTPKIKFSIKQQLSDDKDISYFT